MRVVTRFPPSPTGYFHIGSARTALFNYLFTAKHEGTMYLRFEDTDKERSKKEYEEDILAGLQWLGIPYTPAEPLRQSERLDTYRAYLKKLIDKDAAYEAEAAEGKGNVIRFKNPNIRVTFSDLIRGEVTFDTTELKDFVIARNIDDPLYHMAVVADDNEMGVTHVIRGEDHISNTPRQILILEALGFTRPTYAHIPLILAPDRSKLSKRHGAISVNEYRADGYLPEALVNYLALLGWNPGSDRETFTLPELVEAFSIERVHKSSAIFDLQKLQWLNRQYMHKMPEEFFLRELTRRAPAWECNIAAKLMLLIRERMHVWSDFDALRDEFSHFFSDPHLDAKKIPQKGSDAATALRHLEKVHELFMKGEVEDFSSADTIKNTVWDYATSEGRGDVLWPLRYALSGKEKSQDPFLIASYLGKERTLRRIQAAIDILNQS